MAIHTDVVEVPFYTTLGSPNVPETDSENASFANTTSNEDTLPVIVPHIVFTLGKCYGGNM